MFLESPKLRHTLSPFSAKSFRTCGLWSPIVCVEIDSFPFVFLITSLCFYQFLLRISNFLISPWLFNSDYISEATISSKMRILFFIGLLIVALLPFELALAYKILVYNPKFGGSHVRFSGRIADTLANAGHDVVSFRSFGIFSKSSFKNNNWIAFIVVFSKSLHPVWFFSAISHLSILFSLPAKFNLKMTTFEVHFGYFIKFL